MACGKPYRDGQEKTEKGLSTAPSTIEFLEVVMTEVITVIAVGVGISGLILNGQRNAREEMRNSEGRLREEIGKSEARLRKELQDFKSQVDARFEKIDKRFEQIEGHLGVLERQQAKLEGLLDGLREAISGRAM